MLDVVDGVLLEAGHEHVHEVEVTARAVLVVGEEALPAQVRPRVGQRRDEVVERVVER